MKKKAVIVKFPNSPLDIVKRYNNFATTNEKSILKCEISGRFLEVELPSNATIDTKDIWYTRIDVKTWDANNGIEMQSKPRKLCELIIDAKDILKIADKIRNKAKNK